MKDLAIIVLCIWAFSLIYRAVLASLALRFDLPMLANSAVLGFVGGLLFSFLIAYAWIYNRLVEADRRRAHDRVDKDHDGRRM